VFFTKNLCDFERLHEMCEGMSKCSTLQFNILEKKDDGDDVAQYFYWNQMCLDYILFF
jgi:hypothetical protein